MLIRIGILTAPKIEFEQRENTFILKNVRIGIGFHWDRLEDQEFAGKLEIVESRKTKDCSPPLIPLTWKIISVRLFRLR